MINKYLTYGVAIGSFSYFIYFASNHDKFYQKNLSQIQKKKEEHFKDKNFDLLYNSLAFLYLYKREESMESLLQYAELFKFYKPRKIAFDISNEYYLKNYQDYVKSEDFLNDFRAFAQYVKDRNEPKIKEFKEEKKKSFKDLFHLYTFFKCYDRSCLVYFGDEVHFSEEREKINRVIDIREKASPQVKKLLGDEGPLLDRENFQLGNKTLVDQLFLYATQKGSFF